MESILFRGQHPIGVRGRLNGQRTLERTRGHFIVSPGMFRKHGWLIRDDRKGTRCGFNPVCMHTLT